MLYKYQQMYKIQTLHIQMCKEIN